MSTPAPSGSKALAITTIILGGVSILLAWIFPIFWILLAITAVILGFVSRRKEPTAGKLSLTGIILGFVGIVANIASIVIGALAVAAILQNGA